MPCSRRASRAPADPPLAAHQAHDNATRTATTPDLTSDGWRYVAALNRLNRALDCIDQAQSLVERATQALAAVERARPEHTRLAGLANRLSWTWIALRAAANRLRRSDRSAPHAR